MKPCTKIDQDLLDQTLRIGGFKTEIDAINAALHEFIKRRKQFEITELFGKFDPDLGYDYKTGRL